MQRFADGEVVSKACIKMGAGSYETTRRPRMELNVPTFFATCSAGCSIKRRSLVERKKAESERKRALDLRVLGVPAIMQRHAGSIFSFLPRFR